MLREEIIFFCIPLFSKDWPLFVLAKKFPNGEIVGYLYWLHCLLKQIFIHDVGYDVPTS